MTINNELFESYVSMNNRHLDENLASLKEALLKMAASVDALQNGGKDFNCLEEYAERIQNSLKAVKEDKTRLDVCKLMNGMDKK